jgi:anaerobic selenocysteine-containing dehydrogenase
MAEEIEVASAGEKRMRALVTSSANPVLSAPNGDRLANALGELEFMLSIDIYVNETTSHADLILPTTSQLEHDNFDLIYQTTACRNFARWSPQVFEPEAGLRHHWEVFLRLGSEITGAPEAALDDALLRGMAQQRVGPGSNRPELDAERAVAAVGSERGPMRLLDLMLRAGPYGDGFDDAAPGLSLKKIQVPHAVDLGPLTPRLPEVLKTPGKRIPLAPPYIAADVARLRRRLPERARDSGMLLIGRRQLRNMNSWLHNLPNLAKGRARCTLLIHPADALRLGIANGAAVRVRSRSGAVVAPAEVSDEIMRGVVSLPHGFGHARPGVRTSVATKLQPGANANQLTDELPLDLPSGTHIANGIPVRLELV